MKRYHEKTLVVLLPLPINLTGDGDLRLWSPDEERNRSDIFFLIYINLL